MQQVGQEDMNIWLKHFGAQLSSWNIKKSCYKLDKTEGK